MDFGNSDALILITTAVGISIGVAIVVAKRAGRHDESPALWFFVTFTINISAFIMLMLFADFVPRLFKPLIALLGLQVCRLFEKEEDGDNSEPEPESVHSEVEIKPGPDQEDWIVIKTYIGAIQHYEFQNDIAELQDGGLNPRLIRGTMTSITLHKSEFDKGAELLGIEFEDAPD